MSRTGKHRSRTAAQPGDAAEEADDLRALCRALDFWRVCGKPACRRALDCRGDAEACFRTFWWQMPEEARVWVRAAIRGSAGGMGNKAAAMAADAEVARWHELQTRYAPKPALEPAPAAAAQPPAATPKPAPMPRIRML